MLNVVKAKFKLEFNVNDEEKLLREINRSSADRERYDRALCKVKTTEN